METALVPVGGGGRIAGVFRGERRDERRGEDRVGPAGLRPAEDDEGVVDAVEMDGDRRVAGEIAAFAV